MHKNNEVVAWFDPETDLVFVDPFKMSGSDLVSSPCIPLTIAEPDLEYPFAWIGWDQEYGIAVTRDIKEAINFGEMGFKMRPLTKHLNS